MHAWLALITLLAAPGAPAADLAGSVAAAESTLTAAGLRPGESDYDVSVTISAAAERSQPERQDRLMDRWRWPVTLSP